MVNTQDQRSSGQFDQSIKQFLSELEKTQWKIIRSKVEQESKLLREQIQEEKRVIQELNELIEREQDVIAKIGTVLDQQGRALEALARGRGIDSGEPAGESMEQ
ncbi:MAG: hypothetical protein LUQ40_02975 [Methanomicrobiales archaeon]|nr:hypothetical protein [Methanomicrobiales archaeon]